MMKYIHIATLLLFTILLSAQTKEIEFANLAKYGEENKSITKAPKAVLYGNSITEGWVGAMPEFFEANNYIGRGISGQTSAQLLLRFRQDVINLKPKIIIIKIGTNDVAENNGPYNEQFTLDNIESMVQIAKQNKIKVILASVLPASEFVWRKSIANVSDKILSLNKGIKKLAMKHKITYLDYHSILKNSVNGLDKEMADDGVHPSLRCYEIMAKMAKAAIDKL